MKTLNGTNRRKHIAEELGSAGIPISAASFAKKFGVSRQAIVGDVALLRAEGHDIISTARGYIMQTALSGKYVGTIACKHKLSLTRKELETIVAAGGTVDNVIVTHEHYGDLTGQLNISSQADVDYFMAQIENRNEHLLSELTDGVHLHTITCDGRAAYETILERLAEINVLYSPLD
jgi:transcriptional regulator of NAD metabolism